MKITPIFGIVLAIHAVVIGMLILQPGCQTTTSSEPTAEDTMPSDSSGDMGSNGSTTTTDRSAPPPRDPISSSSTLDEAFNSGFEVDSNRQPSREEFGDTGSDGRDTPTRPDRNLSDRLPESDFSREQDTIALVSDTPRHDNYTVQPGDSLWKIAQQYDVDLDTILEANDLTKKSVIKVGQVILVPLETPELAPVPSGEQTLSGRNVDVDMTSYTVQRGDTLSRIASTFGTTIQEIKSLNNRRSDVIRVGETLMIPKTEGAAGSRESSGSEQSGAADKPEFTHTVRAGENPSMIADRYGMSTRELIRLNGNFDPRRLRVGQVLKVEPEPGREPGRDESTESDSTSSSSNGSGSDEQDPNRPVRIRIDNSTPEPREEPTEDIDPAILLDDVEEIPVLRVEPSE